MRGMCLRRARAKTVVYAWCRREDERPEKSRRQRRRRRRAAKVFVEAACLLTVGGGKPPTGELRQRRPRPTDRQPSSGPSSALDPAPLPIINHQPSSRQTGSFGSLQLVGRRVFKNDRIYVGDVLCIVYSTSSS
jgi:hypothetical protein